MGLFLVRLGHDTLPSVYIGTTDGQNIFGVTRLAVTKASHVHSYISINVYFYPPKSCKIEELDK